MPSRGHLPPKFASANFGAALVGGLAALWPAARAARTRPLEALADG